MADIIKNPTGIHAAIIFVNDELSMVVPDEIWASPGETVKWVVVPPNKVQIVFTTGDSPFPRDRLPDVDGIIVEKIARDATGEYSYAVESEGGNTIDPRIRIKK